jgi:hypothetical protein
MKKNLVLRPVRQNERRPKRVQVGLVSRRNLEAGRLHLNEAFGVKPASREGRNLRTSEQPATSLGMPG